MGIDRHFPEQLAAGCVEGVDVASDITEEGRHPGRSRLDGSDHWRATQARLRLKRPVDAPGGGVDRIEIARIGTNKDPAIHDRRLPVGRISRGKSKRPLQLEPRNRGW